MADIFSHIKQILAIHNNKVFCQEIIMAPTRSICWSPAGQKSELEYLKKVMPSFQKQKNFCSKKKLGNQDFRGNIYLNQENLWTLGRYMISIYDQH